MNLTRWFGDHLQASADGFVWGAEQVPEARRIMQPPDGLGEWTVARHVFHMLYYEQAFALPGMRQWLGEARPSMDDVNEDAAWVNRQTESVESLLVEFRKVRAEQIALIQEFDDDLWGTTRQTVWGTVTLLWVVSKTYQHTAEHTSDVMRIGLFWDIFTGVAKGWFKRSEKHEPGS
jgi:hypothetical protein